MIIKLPRGGPAAIKPVEISFPRFEYATSEYCGRAVARSWGVGAVETAHTAGR